jgi:hypothetical protein
MTATRILGLLIVDRIKEAGQTQEILNKHSRIIKTRLGFQEVGDKVFSQEGFVLLHLVGTPDEWQVLEDELQQIDGILIQKMTFQF